MLVGKAFLRAAAWLVFSPVLLMAVSMRGRSSVMPSLDQHGRLSTLCLLLLLANASTSRRSRVGCPGHPCHPFLSSILRTRMVPICFIFYSVGMNIQSSGDTLHVVFWFRIVTSKVAGVVCLLPWSPTRIRSECLGMVRVGD